VLANHVGGAWTRVGRDDAATDVGLGIDSCEAAIAMPHLLKG
jgi:hypothetical protein